MIQDPIEQDTDLIPAYVPPPGEILKLELQARGWTQHEFASIIGKPPQAVNEIINARKRITPETALRIAAALGTSPELWNNLESAYRLHWARQSVPVQVIREIDQRGHLHTREHVHF